MLEQYSIIEIKKHDRKKKKLMIDTQENTNIKQPIKMIDFNPNTFVNDNLMIMVNHINKLKHIQGKAINVLSENTFLALNNKGRLIIGYKSILSKRDPYGLKPYINKCLRIRHDNETNHAWAQRILQSYCKWLQPYYQTQANAKIPKTIDLDGIFTMQLFTDISYIDWVMQRLDELKSIEDLCTVILTDPNNINYTLQSFIANIRQFKTISQNLLADIISEIGISIKVTPDENIKSSALWTIFLQILIDIANGKDGLPKLICDTDVKINIEDLTKLFS